MKSLDKLMDLGDDLIKYDDNYQKAIKSIRKSIALLDETVISIPIVYPIQSFLDMFHPSNSTSTKILTQMVNNMNELVSTWNEQLKASFGKFNQLKQNIQPLSKSDLKICPLKSKI